MTEVVEVFGSSAEADTHRDAVEPVVADLYCNPYEGIYVVTVDVRATLREEVSAANEVEARDKLLAKIAANEIDLYGEDIDDTRVTSVRRHQPMYLVLRDGEPMGVSRVEPGDLPREPLGEWEASRYRKATTAPEAGAVGTTEGREPQSPTTREGADR